MYRNQLLYNNNMAISGSSTPLIRRPDFDDVGWPPQCKLFIALSLCRYHKILGLFLDRPQDVAVMSLPQRRDSLGVWAS